MTTHYDASRPKRLSWERLTLGAVLCLAGAIRLWGLDQNGFGNNYYAAAVRSMTLSIHNFLFVSFDPAGVVSVDKPPLGLWLQVASVKLFGFTPLSLLLPQALEGIASVVLIHHLVRRHFDAWAAIIAALAMAICPICVAVDRYNNVDSCLVLLLLLATWAFSIATERASRSYLLLGAVLVGFAFNAKMLAAFVVLPTFYLVYLLGARVSRLRKIVDLSLISLPLIVISLSWVLFVDFTPPSERPYVGSTNDNSMMSLSLGWNGFHRLLTRRNWREREVNAVANDTDLQAQVNPRRGYGRGMGTGEPGPFRLIQPGNAGQVAWMFPLVLLGIASFVRNRPLQLAVSPKDQAVSLWAGWLFTYLIVLSFLRGSMHIYYWVMLAPPLAALTGIGATSLWRNFRAGGSHWSSALLPAALILTAAWQTYIVFNYPNVRIAITFVLWLGVAVATLIVVKTGQIRASGEPARPWPMIAAGAGVLSLFAAPLFWSLTPLLAVNKGGSPEASPSLLAAEPIRAEKEKENHKRLLAFLTENHQTEAYLVIGQNARQVAPIIIETGKSAVAFGGFMGRDPILTVESFAQMVEKNQFRFVMLARPGRRGFNGIAGPNADIAKWVREHGKLVEVSRWRLPDEAEAERENEEGNRRTFRGWDRGLANTDLFDLRPPTSPEVVSDQPNHDKVKNSSL